MLKVLEDLALRSLRKREAKARATAVIERVLYFANLRGWQLREIIRSGRWEGAEIPDDVMIGLRYLAAQVSIIEFLRKGAGTRRTR